MKRRWEIILLGTLILSLGCSKNENTGRLGEGKIITKDTSPGLTAREDTNLHGQQPAFSDQQGPENNATANDVVDFNELKDLLPLEINSMKREDAVAEISSAFGMEVSRAEAGYRTPDGSYIIITITDMGKMHGFSTFANLAWMMGDFNRESDTGYEKTCLYEGYKAYEEYNTQTQSGKIQLLVEKRFHIEIEGFGVNMEQMQAAMKATDIDKFRQFKEIGIKD